MSNDIVGFLEEQGYDETDIQEMLGPLDSFSHGTASTAYESGLSRMPLGDPQDHRELGANGTPSQRYDEGEGVSGKHDALRAVLTQAQRERTLPGSQVLVPPGTQPVPPTAKPIRADSEHSYTHLKRSMSTNRRDDGDDSPQNALTIEELAANEDRILMGEGYSRDEFYRRAPIAMVGGDDFYRLARMLGSDQACVACGARAGTAVCGECRKRHAVLGLGERGPASDIYTNELLERPYVNAELLGTASQNELLGDVAALETPGPAYGQTHDVPYEAIDLSYSQPDAMKNTASWQYGDDLYSSIRLTGWDGQPKVLTATVPYHKALATVLGYAQRVGASLNRLAAHKLAQSLGAAGLVPRLCAASPAVLGAIRGQRTPGGWIVVTARGR